MKLSSRKNTSRVTPKVRRVGIMPVCDYSKEFPEVVKWWLEDTSFAASSLRAAYHSYGALTERQLVAARRQAKRFAKSKLASRPEVL